MADPTQPHLPSLPSTPQSTPSSIPPLEPITPLSTRINTPLPDYTPPRRSTGTLTTQNGGTATQASLVIGLGIIRRNLRKIDRRLDQAEADHSAYELDVHHLTQKVWDIERQLRATLAILLFLFILNHTLPSHLPLISSTTPLIITPALLLLIALLRQIFWTPYEALKSWSTLTPR